MSAQQISMLTGTSCSLIDLTGNSIAELDLTVEAPPDITTDEIDSVVNAQTLSELAPELNITDVALARELLILIE